ADLERWLEQSRQSATGPAIPARGYDPAAQQFWQQLLAMPTTGTVLPAPPALEREVARQRAGLGPPGMSPEDWALMQQIREPQVTPAPPGYVPGTFRANPAPPAIERMYAPPQGPQGYVPGQFAPNLGQLYRQPWGMR